MIMLTIRCTAITRYQCNQPISTTNYVFFTILFNYFTVIVAAITSKVKKTMPTHVVLTSDCLTGGSIALLEQLRTIDKLRLGEYIGKLGKEDMRRVEEALLISLGVEKDGDKGNA